MYVLSHGVDMRLVHTHLPSLPPGMVCQDVIVGERRFQYEAEVSKNPLNYDSWFDYIRLEEAAGDHEKVREVCAGLCAMPYAAQWYACHTRYANCTALQSMPCYLCLHVLFAVTYTNTDASEGITLMWSALSSQNAVLIIVCASDMPMHPGTGFEAQNL